MKKIMFNDKYGLTRAVLDGRKTQTRRVIKSLNDAYNIDSIEVGLDGHDEIYFTPYIEGKPTQDIYPSYRHEDVAVAQSYYDCGYSASSRTMQILPGHFAQVSDGSAGWNNKMFVRADLMPHRIRITNIRVERLQDISDEDCLKEGIREHPILINNERWYVCPGGALGMFPSARKAFATLIDKVSGKGTWEKNPWVLVYEFELIK